jgi:carbonic anhydrase
MNCKAAASEFVSNGHTLQVNCTPGSALMMAGCEFDFNQLHFHAPNDIR